MTHGAGTWLHCSLPRPAARHLLICFPHAGGSAAFFRNWGVRLTGCEVHAARYPGRAERIEEPQPTDLRQLAMDFAKSIEAIADRPIALFGHSMGAVVALEAARVLEARGVRIVRLFASGSQHGPCSVRHAELVDEDDDAVAEQLVQLGGTQREMAVDPIFRELVLPSVRADGQMFHAYEMSMAPRLRCPVTTIVGDADLQADTRPWSDLAPTGFEERTVSGDHFYLIAHPPFAVLRACLDASANAEAPAP